MTRNTSINRRRGTTLIECLYATLVIACFLWAIDAWTRISLRAAHRLIAADAATKTGWVK